MERLQADIGRLRDDIDRLRDDVTAILLRLSAEAGSDAGPLGSFFRGVGRSLPRLILATTTARPGLDACRYEIWATRTRRGVLCPGDLWPFGLTTDARPDSCS